MADTRVGSLPEPRLPISTGIEETETAASQAPMPSPSQGAGVGDQQTARTTDALKRNAGESKGQNDLRGQLLRQGLDQALTSGQPSRQPPGTHLYSSNSNPPLNPGGAQQGKTGAPTSIGGTTYAQRSQEHAIRGLQTQLNRWRAATGQPPIPVNGQNDKATEDAIREFQNKSGLTPANGIANQSTRERMSLLIDIEGRMAGKRGPAANLNAILASPGFRDMPEPMQTELLRQVRRYAGGHASGAIAHLKDLVSQAHFEDLPVANKEVLLNSFYQHPYAAHADLLKRAADSILFQFLSPELQTEALDRLSLYPENSDQFDNIVALFNNRDFQSVDSEVRDQILEGMPKRFNPGQLTPFNVPNLVKLASEPDFAKVRPEARDLMLDVLSQRLDNPQLADALGQLSQDMRFRNDHRTWRQTIWDVDSSVQ